jgi:hypothetical protein
MHVNILLGTGITTTHTDNISLCSYKPREHVVATRPHSREAQTGSRPNDKGSM